MASAVAEIGGTVVYDLAFTESNFFILKTGENTRKKRERHDKAVEQLEADQAAWSQKRMQRTD